MLMPPDLRDWLLVFAMRYAAAPPENHIARFVVELVEGFDGSSFQVNDRGTGSAQYAPSMPSMLAALLIYCYATGRFESRRIEDGLNIPDEITRRKDRIERLKQARAVASLPNPTTKIFSGSGNFISVNAGKTAEKRL